MKTPASLGILGTIVLLFFLCVLFIGGCGEHYSDGERTGTVIKLSHKGFFVKTWEGDMNLGGAVNTAEKGLVANVWHFTVSDEALLPKVQEAQRTGKTITVKYNEWLVAPIFRTDKGYILSEIR